MTDWLVNKGAGPWDFLAQKDKLGYINNPRWTSTPASLIDHDPCGYWLKGPTPEITNTGPLWGAGVDEYGQLGWDQGQLHAAPIWFLPNFTVAGNPCYAPFRELPDSKWGRVSLGGGHVVHLREDGTIWTGGLNLKGRLGLGDLITRYNLVKIGTDTDWAFVTCGDSATFAIKRDGTLWAAGENTSLHSLGVGDTVDHNVFTRVPGTGWKWITAGTSHAVAQKTDGSLWITGSNEFGQQGTGSIDFDPHQNFTQIAGDWITAACGRNHTMLLGGDGGLRGTGYNQNGELGVGDFVHKSSFTLTLGTWTDVKAGANYTVGIKGVNSSLWTTGLNTYGELGLGDVSPRNVFTQVTSLPRFRQVAPGYTHMMLIGVDNSLWGCGHNAYGELGVDPGGAHTDQSVGAQLIFTRVGTENNWLRLWESGYYPSSVVIRATEGTVIVAVPVNRPSPIWTMPT